VADAVAVLGVPVCAVCRGQGMVDCSRTLSLPLAAGSRLRLGLRVRSILG
jgi:hypothetical protein